MNRAIKRCLLYGAAGPVVAALGRLGTRCRDLFRWKLEGKSFAEIQALMGQRSINTIYTWDYRCRRQLLDVLGGAWE